MPRLPSERRLSELISSDAIDENNFEAIAAGLRSRNLPALPPSIADALRGVMTDEIKRADATARSLADEREQQEWEAKRGERRRNPSMIYGCLLGPFMLFISGVIVLASFDMTMNRSANGLKGLCIGGFGALISLYLCKIGLVKVVGLWNREAPDKSTTSDWLISSTVLWIKRKVTGRA